MFCLKFRSTIVCITAALGAALIPHQTIAQSWIAPTPEELHMTSIPEVPGAEAVVLNRDEVDDDDNHMRSIYFRVKILTEGGIKQGDVELEYDKRGDTRGYTVENISGRTIQPDGTIVPFTGKPYDKLLRKDKENAYTARVFSLPAVQVGSIIEYRYYVRWDDHIFFHPSWVVQTDFFLRKGHFQWKPTNKELRGTTRGGRENLSNRITWASTLPQGTDVKMTRLANDRLNIELNVANVTPFLNEEYMPPIRSSRYHVFFYYTPYRTNQEFWDTELKYWSSDTGKFLKAGDDVRQAAQTATAGATTEEDKARKLYAFVMTLENTDYTRKRTTQEEKAEIKSADDVLRRKRGSSDQIAMTYVALARAAGLQAYVMAVADRQYLIFDMNWMDMGSQLTDDIAVVRYANEDHYVDPGARYSPFGHLSWEHTMTAGVRQDNPDRTKPFAQTPSEGYKYSHSSRVADVKLANDGRMTGVVTFTYEGSPALRWRHVALRNDEGELREQMKKEMEHLLPGGTEVEIQTIEEMDNGEKPLKITAHVDGHVGNAVGSRVMLPSDLFEANSRPTFTHDKREQGVYFPYAQMVQDVVRYVLPAGFSVEAAPPVQTAAFQRLASYTQRSSQTANSVTVRRDLVLGDLYFPVKDYPELRVFYNDFEHKDHGSVVLKRGTESATLQQPSGK